MSITLLCLVKGNTTASAFAIDIDREKLVSHLKDAIKEKKQNDFAGIDADRLKLWKVSIPGDQDDQLRNLILQDSDELLAIRKISKYFPDSPPKEHIHVIVKLPRKCLEFLSLEEALSCIPPPITYSTDCVTLKTTTKAVGDLPARPDYVYSRKSTDTPGIPDFNCHLVGSLILVMEAKKKHVLEDIGEQTFPEFYQTILKAYAYLTRRAKENPKSPKPQVVVPVQGDNDSRTLRSHSKSSSNSSLNQQQSSSTFANQQSSSNTSVKQNNYSFSDFKFKSILGEGRSGKTLLCEFRGDMIALKSADLSKAPSYVLKEMQKEVEIYKDLADIQGKYIPKLICYGYYGRGMSFVIGLTIVGTMLSDHKITKRQRSRAIKGLEAIHKHGILHNDIREKNILINDNGDIYLIDFGMASREDTKKKRKLFDKEQLKLSQLLDRYIM
ncbi:kinase-like domain-containing protein [Rhizophagus irregularis DAOM 181602=DAOM 197198]|nr:kinase-like domain-containing protein [Rhizophagus irregularis DAOM 181602=DAOM 197198]